ncbi:uncharacterized protein [Nicotiana tomentosiformis]|uniref:uncharacterized protein n=1 Tax=Nicotiana tomentosiformis TaxID=4098 RepID=UPI00388C3B13
MAFYLGMNDGMLRYHRRLCVPNIDGLRGRIMIEAHNSKYSVHPVSTKMYHDLKKVYLWNDMKRDEADFMASCPNCQQMKVEHQQVGDDQYGLCGRSTLQALQIKEIVRLLGTVVSLISDRGTQFTANFWQNFQQVYAKMPLFGNEMHFHVYDISLSDEYVVRISFWGSLTGG